MKNLTEYLEQIKKRLNEHSGPKRCTCSPSDKYQTSRDCAVHGKEAILNRWRSEYESDLAKLVRVVEVLSLYIKYMQNVERTKKMIPEIDIFAEQALKEANAIVGEK